MGIFGPYGRRDDILNDLLLFKDFNRKGISVTLHKLKRETRINVVANTKYSKLGIFLDVRCYDTENIASLLAQATEYRMFDELHHWMVLGSSLEYVSELVDDGAFGLSTEFVIGVMSGSDTYRLHDVYNTMKERGTRLNVTSLGVWSVKGGLDISLIQPKLARRSNMHRLVFKAMFFKCTYKTDDVPLDYYLSDYGNATKDVRNKFGYQILVNLADLYNFSLEAYETAAWEVGDRLGPVAKALEKHEGDITGCPLNINIERSYVLKYVHEDWHFRTFFIFRNPQSVGIKMQVIFRPFENKIWYFLLTVFVLAVIIFAIVFNFDGKSNKATAASNSFLITVGALSQQGTDMKLKNSSTRIVFFFIMIFSLLMYNYYSASVVSARLAQPIYKINDSLYEFSKLNLKISTEWMVYLQYFFNVPNWEVQHFYRNVWLKIPESDLFMEPEAGIRLVKKGGFAYHCHPDIGYPYIEKLFDNQEICELMEVHLGRPAYTAFAVSYNSSFQELSRVGLTKIAEIGLRQREIVKWQYRKPYCRKDLLNASSITIYEFAPFLILLTMGILLSINICIVEVLIASRNKTILQA